MASESSPVRWLEAPEEHDYPAAADYLELIADQATIDALISLIHAVPVVHKKAKDILRAAQLALLPPDNPYVRRDLSKILAGKPLSPILMVRGDLAAGTPAQIADGYHRVCACYHTDEDLAIPVKIVGLHDVMAAPAETKPDSGKSAAGKSKSKK